MEPQPKPDRTSSLKGRASSLDLIAGRYLLIRPLSQGGMGEVYLVRDKLQNGAERALKTIRNRFDSANQRDQFLKEFKTLSLLSHEGIVKSYEYGRAEAFGDYFTMEYVPWPTLDTLQGQLTVNQVIHILYDLARTLSVIHCQSIIHADLKPNNIFINTEALNAEPISEHVLKICDFGLARSSMKNEESAIPRGAFVYTAPEILEGKYAEARSDIYSLGMIGYVLLNSRIPFTAITVADLNTEKKTYIPTSADWNETVPKSVRDLLTRCLVPEIKFRPRSCMEVISELGRFAKHVVEDHFSFGSASFVSRSSELRHLGSLWHNVKAGEQWAYLVTGEDGIGKSRIIDEFALRANIEGANVLRLEENDISPLQARLKVESSLGDNEKESLDILSSELKKITLSAPAIVCWHDFHLATTYQQEWLRNYLTQEPSSPLFWLLEAKTEPILTTMLSFRDHFVRRKLSELDDDAFIEIMSQQLDSADGYDTLTKRLIGLVGRKPKVFFQSLTDLARHGFIKLQNGRWQIVDPELINWREGISNGIWNYDRGSISPVAATLAEWFAVLDQECPLSDAKELLTISPLEWGRLIAELERSGIFEVADGVIRIALPLIQNSIYLTQPVEIRRKNHLWVAKWLEERLPQTPSRQSLFVIAKHYHRANEKANFLRMVRRAIQVSSVDTLKFIDLDLLVEALHEARGKWPFEDILRAYEDVAFSYLAINRPKEAAQIFEFLLVDESFNGIVDPIRTRLRLGHCLRVAGDNARAIIEFEKLDKLIGETVSDLRADVYANLGFSYFLTGEMKKSLVIVKSFQQMIDRHIKTDLTPKHWYPCASLLIRHNKFKEGI